MERIAVSKELGYEVETVKDWLKRTYNIEGESLYECIQNNEAYKTIEAPKTLKHRYIFEDIPHGLVAIEAVGERLGLNMRNTSLIIDLASSLMDVDFRKIGRNLNGVFEGKNGDDVRALF